MSRLPKYLILVACILVLVALVRYHVAEAESIKPPSDEELLKFFAAERSSLNSLCSIALQDVGRAYFVSADSGTGLSKERFDAYRALIKIINPDLVVRIDRDDISFCYWSGGVGTSVNRSWIKGLAYLPHGSKRVGVLVPDLSAVYGHDGIFLRAIEGNWYIVYANLD